MKFKLLFSLLLLVFFGCKKSELTIAPNIEKEIGESVYSTTKISDEYKATTFIDPKIQKTSEEVLKEALITNQADYGCVVIMETTTGRIKAMVNLNKADDGSYNYKEATAVSQANEPGGLMRTFDLLALLEDNKADTTSVYDTHGGEISFFGKKIQDSHLINGKISLANAFTISSNSVFAQAINNSYSTDANLFCNRYKKLGFDKPLDLPFTHEGAPIFPDPKSKEWSSITLPWLSIGYGLTLTPIQILTFYNSIANNGVMVKPLFLSEIKNKEGNTKKYLPQVLNSKIASPKTISTLQFLLTKKINGAENEIITENNVKVAGSAATISLDYAEAEIKEKRYLSSFVGYFPANKPKYSILCFIYNPKVNVPVYSSLVSGKAIKSIIEKIK